MTFSKIPEYPTFLIIFEEEEGDKGGGGGANLRSSKIIKSSSFSSILEIFRSYTFLDLISDLAYFD